jgi:hypothetical protein
MFMDEVSTRGFLEAGGAGLLLLGGATGGGANEDDMMVSRLIRMDEIGSGSLIFFKLNTESLLEYPLASDSRWSSSNIERAWRHCDVWTINKTHRHTTRNVR